MTRDRRQLQPMVTASALGQYVFCPEASRLAALGARPHTQARRSMAAGEVSHHRWQRKEDAAAWRESRVGRFALILAMLLAILAFIWWVGQGG